MFISFIIPPDLRKEPLEQVISWGKECGFDAVDLGAAQMAEGVEICKKVGLKVGLVMQGVPREALDYDPATRKEGVKRACEIIDFCAARNISTIMAQSVTPSDDSAKNFEAFKDTYPEIVSYAADKGVTVVVENCPHGGCAIGYSPEWWRKMFETIPSENFGLCFDPSHLVWLGIDYIKALKEFAKHIKYVHAKDTELLPEGRYEYGILGRQFDESGSKPPWFRSGWWRYRIPGAGLVNWKTFFDALKEIGYDGAVSLEHEDPEYEGSPEKAREGLKKGVNFLKALIARA